MAVTSVTPVRSVAQKDGDGHRTYTVTYRALSNSSSDGPKTVLDHADCPTVGDTYSFGGETDTAAFFDGATPRYQSEDESWKVWLVEARFATSKSSTRDPQDPPDDPLAEAPIIRTFAHKTKKAILKDRDGRMIASSAGEPYDPVQERDATRYMLRIIMTQLDVNPPFYARYRDAINDDPFFGCAVETVKVEVPGAIDVLYGGGRKYYKVLWEFAIRSAENLSPAAPYPHYDDFNLTLYDYGMCKLLDGELISLKDKLGRPLTSPRLLDGEGGVLSPGFEPVPLDPFQQYRKLPFAPLGLPNWF
jgi:hypothetical protein